MEIERRAFVGEVRAAEDGAPSIGGYAAVFGVRTTIGDYFTEEIAPGAFDGVLGDDVRCLFNHSPDHILGRTSAGTLRLSQDAKGLRYENDINTEDPDAMVVASRVRRRDITGNSFSFEVAEDTWDYTGDLPHRTVNKYLRLYDVGPVTFPAYEATEVSARSKEAAAKERTPEPKAPDFSNERERLRLAEHS